MKTLFLLLFTVLMTSCMKGQEATRLSADDLKVVIYPGNNDFAIVHVSLNKNYRDFGYDYVGIATSGKPSKNRWSTRLLIDTRADRKEALNFAMTIPVRATKKNDKFFLQEDRPLLKSPSKKVPLTINYADEGYADEGFFVFQTTDSSKKWIKINLHTNQIELSWEPQKQFDVRWNKNGFDIFSGSTKIAAWCWKIDSKIGFRGSNSGNSSIYEENNSGMSNFSKKELFYLQ